VVCHIEWTTTRRFPCFYPFERLNTFFPSSQSRGTHTRGNGGMKLQLGPFLARLHAYDADVSLLERTRIDFEYYFLSELEHYAPAFTNMLGSVLLTDSDGRRSVLVLSTKCTLQCSFLFDEGVFECKIRGEGLKKIAAFCYDFQIRAHLRSGLVPLNVPPRPCLARSEVYAGQICVLETHPLKLCNYLHSRAADLSIHVIPPRTLVTDFDAQIGTQVRIFFTMRGSQRAVHFNFTLVATNAFWRMPQRRDRGVITEAVVRHAERLLRGFVDVGRMRPSYASFRASRK